MMSSSLGPKIYLRGAILHMLKYGGLGHRPLLYEELILGESYWCSLHIYMFLWETHQHLAFNQNCFFANGDVKYHLQFGYSKPKPFLSQKHSIYVHKSNSLKLEVPEVQASIPLIIIIIHQVVVLEYHPTLCRSLKRKEKGKKGGGGLSASRAG